MTDSQNAKNMKFETAIQELDHIVKRLESGQEDLDISITLFERGAQLQRYCQEVLDAAQLRVEKILQNHETKEVKIESLDHVRYHPDKKTP